MELERGMLYVADASGKQFEIANVSCESAETDTCSPNETPDVHYHLTGAASVSLEVSAMDLSCLDYKPFEPSKTFWFEYNIEIMSQARWHKKKRINKKWLKRYGMKSDTVKIKAKARVLEYDYMAGEFEFESDEFEYIWRPDQLRHGLKIEF